MRRNRPRVIQGQKGRETTVATTGQLRPGGSCPAVSANQRGNARAIAKGRSTAVSGQHHLPAGQGTGRRGLHQAAVADLDLGGQRDRSGPRSGYRRHVGAA
jgi:hypothetical protein